MEIKKILVALDGSKNSQRALEMAIVLAKRPKDKTFSTKAEKQILSPRTILGAVSYTHLTLPTTPYV